MVRKGGRKDSQQILTAPGPEPERVSAVPVALCLRRTGGGRWRGESGEGRARTQKGRREKTERTGGLVRDAAPPRKDISPLGANDVHVRSEWFARPSSSLEDRL
jgi:hypothetical protein